MKIVNLRLEPTLWRKASKEKKALDKNWEEYFEFLFNSRLDAQAILEDSK